MLISVSACFYTLFLFDTLGDAVGFQGAYWVLIVMPLMPLCMYSVYTWYNRRSNSSMTSNDAKAAGEGLGGGVAEAVTDVEMVVVMQATETNKSTMSDPPSTDNATYNAMYLNNVNNVL